MVYQILLLLQILTSCAWSVDLICESSQNLVCRSDVTHPSSEMYGLQQNFSSTSYYGHIILTVYGKFCPDIDTEGPVWYRLEPIYPTKGLGFLRRPEQKWSTIKKNDGIEVFNSDKPLAMLDLPRQYTWYYIQETNTEKHCFKLTIQQGTSCQQILTPDCQDISNNNTQVTTAAETTQANEAQPSTTPPPANQPTLNPPSQCRSCENVTVKESSLTCGSDGRIYGHVCYLRQYRCLYDDSLQRDKSWKSCRKQPSTPTVPTPTDPSENPKHSCLYQKKVHRELYMDQSCDCRGQFKPIQCRRSGNSTTCYCSSGGGSKITGYNDWTFSCDKDFASTSKQRCTP